MLCMFYGLSITELAKATALMFTVPIFATILAIIFLKEIVGIRRWLAMLWIYRSINCFKTRYRIRFGPLLILCASLMWSSSMLMAKNLHKQIHSKYNILQAQVSYQQHLYLPYKFGSGLPFNN